jgi:spermidine synthase
MLNEPNNPRPFFTDDRIQLFVLSFLSLFVEIMLIRHLSSEIRIFAYFKNLTLIGAFFGLGVGYLLKPKINLLVTLAAVTFLALATNPTTGFIEVYQYLNLSDLNTWEPAKAGVGLTHLAAGVGMVMLIFFAIIISMAPLGQAMAVIFDRSKNRIVDYSVNIVASLAGIWFFALLSFLWTPPLLWYLLVFAVIGLGWKWSTKGTVAVFAAAIVTVVSLVTAPHPGLTESHWSPYQLVTLRPQTMYFRADLKDPWSSFPFHTIGANNTFYLNLFDLSDAARERFALFFDTIENVDDYYNFPYLLPEKLDEVLILGAGGGNDVAAALRAGAKHVTAVEIDPAIIDLGRRYHPEQPYSSDKVTIVNDDARNFLRNTDKTYDVIALGMLDSHTLTSNFSNTNLDSFMYTMESVADMRARLNGGGVLALSFYLTHPWIGSKIYQMIETQFGVTPRIVSFQTRTRGSFSGTYFVVDKQQGRLVDSRIAGNEEVKAQADGSDWMKENIAAAHGEPQTDDWPYLYVKERSIPQLHLVVSGLLVMIFLVIYGVGFGAPKRSDIHFAALGAGFLLLEVGVISRFALFWGATWIISSIIISIILLAILAANTAYLKLPKKIGYGPLYGMIFASLAGLYVLPLTSNLAAILYLIPFTLIAYLFATSFDRAERPGRALGFNLLGALVGGLTESASFVTGLSALILIAILFYFVSAKTAGPAGDA